MVLTALVFSFFHAENRIAQRERYHAWEFLGRGWRLYLILGFFLIVEARLVMGIGTVGILIMDIHVYAAIPFLGL